MPKPASPKSACRCHHCRCRRHTRCRCHEYSSLLALALWDYGRSLRRHKNLR